MAITQDDYLRLVGLLALAKDHNKFLDEIERSAARILKLEDEDEGGGGRPYFGHLSDAVYGSGAENAAALLELMEIAVELPQEPEPKS